MILFLPLRLLLLSFLHWLSFICKDDIPTSILNLLILFVLSKKVVRSSGFVPTHVLMNPDYSSFQPVHPNIPDERQSLQMHHMPLLAAATLVPPLVFSL